MTSYSAPTRTVNDVLTDAKRAFGDESGTVLEETDIIRWLNDAMDVIVSTNKPLKSRAVINTVIGQNEYPIDQLNIHEIETIHYNDLRLPNIAFNQFEEWVRTNASAGSLNQAMPQLWYVWNNLLTLWPTPDAVAQLTIYYTPRPTHVENTPSTILPIPDKYYQDIVRYVLWNAFEMTENTALSQLKQAQFNQSLTSFGEEERSEQNATYSTITVIDDFY